MKFYKIQKITIKNYICRTLSVSTYYKNKLILLLSDRLDDMEYDIVRSLLSDRNDVELEDKRKQKYINIETRIMNSIESVEQMINKEKQYINAAEQLELDEKLNEIWNNETGELNMLISVEFVIPLNFKDLKKIMSFLLFLFFSKM